MSAPALWDEILGVSLNRPAGRKRLFPKGVA